MARYNEKRITYRTQDKLMDLFCETIFQFESKIAIKNFLKDLLNRQERLMLIRRLLIAEMLINKSTYQEIVNRLHCGSATVARVERWLNFGRGGYKYAIKLQKKSK